MFRERPSNAHPVRRPLGTCLLSLAVVAFGLFGCTSARPDLIVADRAAKPRIRRSVERKAPERELLPEPSVSVKATARLGKPLTIESCVGDKPCEKRWEYPVRPFRNVRETALSLSKDYFFVWSKPDGRALELDIFKTSRGGSGLTPPINNDSPGFGGTLLWVEGDTLLHYWGCGTGCLEMRWRDTKNHALLTSGGSRLEVDETRKRALLVTDSHEFKLLLLAPRTIHTTKVPTREWLTNVIWEQSSLIVETSVEKFRCFALPTELKCLPLA